MKLQSRMSIQCLNWLGEDLYEVFDSWVYLGWWRKTWKWYRKQTGVGFRVQIRRQFLALRKKDVSKFEFGNNNINTYTHGKFDLDTEHVGKRCVTVCVYLIYTHPFKDGYFWVSILSWGMCDMCVYIWRFHSPRSLTYRLAGAYFWHVWKCKAWILLLVFYMDVLGFILMCFFCEHPLLVETVQKLDLINFQTIICPQLSAFHCPQAVQDTCKVPTFLVYFCWVICNRHSCPLNPSRWWGGEIHEIHWLDILPTKNVTNVPSEKGPFSSSNQHFWVSLLTSPCSNNFWYGLDLPPSHNKK